MPEQLQPEISQSFFGDIMTTSNKDLATDSSTIARSYIAENRLKANNGEWGYDLFGANINEFIGKKNTRENGKIIEERIMVALSYDGLFNSSGLDIRAVPISQTAITVIIVYFGEVVLDRLVFSYVNGFDTIE